MAVVLHHSRAAGTRKLVLLGIANHLGDGGAWPAVTTLARYANVNERNVQRAIEWLVSKGELRVDVQQGGDRATADHRRPNRYDVLVECPSYCDRSTQHRDTRKRGTATRQLALSTGVAPASPHPSTGVAPAPPVGVAPAPPEPSLEPSHPHHPAASTTGPARELSCLECSAPSRAVCQLRQAKLAPADRHPYRPRTPHATR